MACRFRAGNFGARRGDCGHVVIIRFQVVLAARGCALFDILERISRVQAAASPVSTTDNMAD
jgi:hypothetical protein